MGRLAKGYRIVLRVTGSIAACLDSIALLLIRVVLRIAWTYTFSPSSIHDTRIQLDRNWSPIQMSASDVVTAPLASGRFFVRATCLSMCRSIQSFQTIPAPQKTKLHMKQRKAWLRTYSDVTESGELVILWDPARMVAHTERRG